MRIGIFVGYGPQVVLGKEGLGRYLGYLIEGMLKQNQDMVLACPEWLLPSLHSLMGEFGIQESKVKCVTERTPPVWKLYKHFCIRERKEQHFFSNAIQFFEIALSKFFRQIVEDTTNITFILHCILGALALMIALIPGILVILIYYLSRGILKLTRGRGRLSNWLKGFIQSIDIGISHSANNLWTDGFNIMLSNVCEQLVRKINAEGNVDCWYIPSLFWPEAAGIKGYKIFCAPDLVSREYAVSFRSVHGTELASAKCSQTLQSGNQFITYCDYLRRSLLIDQFAKPYKNVVSIPHANNDLSHYIHLNDKAIQQACNSNKNFTEAYCRQICDLGDIHYIFYASQIRPYKNVLNLLKAYERLLRTQKINCKLVLTGNITIGKENDFIKSHKLENEVLSCYNVSAKKLAALYYCADLVVNPTLYEGGFPFTFGEGMSVGTPSIMSRIPQVQDVLKPANLEDVMFDPYNWRDIANKIEYWLPRAHKLYQKELPLYQQLAKRTPDVVANEYIKAFEYFMELETNECEKENAC